MNQFRFDRSILMVHSLCPCRLFITQNEPSTEDAEQDKCIRVIHANYTDKRLFIIIGKELLTSCIIINVCNIHSIVRLLSHSFLYMWMVLFTCLRLFLSSHSFFFSSVLRLSFTQRPHGVYIIIPSSSCLQTESSDSTLYQLSCTIIPFHPIESKRIAR